MKQSKLVPWRAVAIAAVAGLLLAAGVAVARGGDDQPWYGGGQWRLVSIQADGREVIEVPPPPDARSGIGMSFQSDDRLVIWDGVRPVNSSYEPVEQSFRITGEAVSGLVADVGDDPLLNQVSAAVATMLHPDTVVAVSQDGHGRLVLDPGDVTLVLARTDAALPTSAPTPRTQRS